MQFRSYLCQHLQVGACRFGDGLRGSVVDGSQVHQVTADAKGACAGAEEASAVCRVTPPVGMSLRNGKGASRALR